MGCRLLSIAGIYLLWGIARAASGAADDAGAREELRDLVDGAGDALTKLSGLQVVVVEDERPVFEFAHGLASLKDDSSSALTIEHTMRVASISKLVTAIGVMKLVERGLVDLDSDISEYLDFPLRNPHFPDRPITLRMLLSHISSIRDKGQYWIEHGRGRFVDLFYDKTSGRARDLKFASDDKEKPGVFFHYSNLNFGLVAAVIENVTNRRFDRYMRSEVLGPAGVDADYNVCHLLAQPDGQLATLFRKRNRRGQWIPDGPWLPQVDGAGISCVYGMEPVPRSALPKMRLPEYEPGLNPTLFSPHGGLRASAKDLARFARMLLNGGMLDGARILHPESVRAMRRPQWTHDTGLDNGVTYEKETDPAARTAGRMTSYGLSLHRVDLRDWGLAECRRILVGHVGNAYGLFGQLWIDFKSRSALVALITGTAKRPRPADGAAPVYRLEAAILDWWTRHFPRAGCQAGDVEE